ncbi:GNAT family N-acetyltransferase [Aestuariibaculum sediminum]|uniref:GNAT family N-acetyltransferase n=1 Tax=Aestuariibaculum sediminum TaxID=2770637 RepID=A0A8J6PZI6_9FLAO|nr:GNAT family N-acetyltransferase [Aestuariibaculum sediminum]MBD0832253.1 GNAT family N-acetyltransferase [Aestuariibaculum sediminum]
MKFYQCLEAELFFAILPLDWQEQICPFWQDYKSSTLCFVLEENKQIVAGGLMFTKCTPDMLYAQNEADFWFEQGFAYLGFIYVIEAKRGQNLGSIWLTELKLRFPQGKFWLTIEDIGLHNFYVKNHFRYMKSLHHNSQVERLYTYNK